MLNVQAELKFLQVCLLFHFTGTWATIDHGESGYPCVKEAHSGFREGVVDTRGECQ